MYPFTVAPIVRSALPRSSLAALLAAGVVVADPSGAAASDMAAASDTATATTALHQVRLLARVVKRHGAALRSAPSGDAEAIYNLACNDLLPVVGSQDGWYEVLDGGTVGWVGGGRVVVEPNPGFADCRDAVSFQHGHTVGTHVDRGCLSLREPRPGRPIC